MYYRIEQIVNVLMSLGARALAVKEETYKSGVGEGKKEPSGN